MLNSIHAADQPASIEAWEKKETRPTSTAWRVAKYLLLRVLTIFITVIVGVFVTVAVLVAVPVLVAVAVGVGVPVSVGVAVTVGVDVLVAVGAWTMMVVAPTPSWRQATPSCTNPAQ